MLLPPIPYPGWRARKHDELFGLAQLRGLSINRILASENLADQARKLAERNPK